MSSTISTTEIQTMAPEAMIKLKSDDKPYRLARTSSIEKIKRFNTFICSQQYYLLPALFSWLKSSQPSTERAIYLFKATLFNTFFYKFFQTGLRSTASGGKKVKTQKGTRVVPSTLIANFFQKFTKCFESTFLLTIAVYSACTAVLLQLVLAMYLMYLTILPYGFIFMVSCMLIIKYLCFKSFFFLCVRNSAKRDIKNK